MRKILGIDIETTGLDAKRHGVIQIGMFVDIDGKLEDTLLVNIMPFADDILDIEGKPIAWEEIGYVDGVVENIKIVPSEITVGELAFQHVSPKQALPQIIAFLDKRIDKFDKSDKAYLMGFNLQFDLGFMSEWFRKLNFKYFGSYTNYRPLDTYHVACRLAYMGKLDSIENLKLETLCRHFGIEIEAHNALSDILATRALWYELAAGGIEK